MSRYVKHKHGLVIGSDNLFSYHDEAGKLHSFPVIISVDRYYFDEINTVNVFVRTPAEQLIWDQVKVEVPIEWKGEILGREERTRFEPTQWIQQWCNANAPGWAASPSSVEDRHPNLFFQKRGHAVAFARAVDTMFKGMKFGH